MVFLQRSTEIRLSAVSPEQAVAAQEALSPVADLSPVEAVGMAVAAGLLAVNLAVLVVSLQPSTGMRLSAVSPEQAVANGKNKTI